jgi:hypothetical protein
VVVKKLYCLFWWNQYLQRKGKSKLSNYKLLMPCNVNLPDDSDGIGQKETAH